MDSADTWKSTSSPYNLLHSAILKKPRGTNSSVDSSLAGPKSTWESQ